MNDIPRGNDRLELLGQRNRKVLETFEIVEDQHMEYLPQYWVCYAETEYSEPKAFGVSREADLAFILASYRQHGVLFRPSFSHEFHLRISGRSRFDDIGQPAYMFVTKAETLLHRVTRHKEVDEFDRDGRDVCAESDRPRGT